MEPLNIAGNCGTDKHQKEKGKNTKRKEREKAWTFKRGSAGVCRVSEAAEKA